MGARGVRERGHDVNHLLEGLLDVATIGSRFEHAIVGQEALGDDIVEPVDLGDFMVKTVLFVTHDLP